MYTDENSIWYYLSFWQAPDTLLLEAELEEFQQQEANEALPVQPLPEEDLPF